MNDINEFELSNLYKRDTYLNKDYKRMFNVDIYEYDMHHAGISICKEFTLIPRTTIEEIEKTSKDKKDIAIKLGNLQRNDADFKNNLKEGFIRARKLFFEANRLEDTDILSIKKDAIFTLKPCDKLRFGEILFVEKNHYTSYIYTNKYEFYYNVNKLDVKGVGEANLYKHKDYMLKIVQKFFSIREMGDNIDAIRYIMAIINKYKHLELDWQYYRQFGDAVDFISKDFVTYTDIGNDMLPDIFIHTNFDRILIPLLSSVM